MLFKQEKEIKMLYKGTALGFDNGLEVTPGRIYRVLERKNDSGKKYYIYDDFSIEKLGVNKVLIPRFNCFLINPKEMIYFTEVE